MVTSKTNTTIRAYGTSALTARHPVARQLKRDGHLPTIHGNKVWRSSYALMDYFKQNPVPRKSRVLDVGCGWGLTGIYLAKKFNCKVLGIDADKAVAPYLHAQAALNGVNIEFRRQKFQQVKVADFQGIHTVVGADICFWDELTGPLYNMINRALQADVQQILVADPGRQPFFDLANRCDDKLRCSYFTRTVSKPAKSTKHILLIRQG
jgi:predicted nicotinamide N-methyase